MPRHQPLVHANSRCWLYNETSILILDHSKFDRKAMTWVCGLEAVSHLVVDELPQSPLLEQAARAGIQIHVAPGN